MPSWVNRTVLSGSSTAANGTTSHTCTFTAATAGNMLVAIVSGAVTFTTPSGWTLQTSAVNFSGLYLFTKTASASESSFTTTHNGSNYAIEGLVYEFYTGSSYINGNSATGQGRLGVVNGPTVSSLSGTYTRFSARSWTMGNLATTSSCVWTLPSIEDYDVYTLSGANDGIYLTTAYDDGATGSSFTPSSTVTNDCAGSGEGIAFALSVISPPGASGIALNWLSMS